MTLEQAENCRINNTPVWWRYKRWRKVLIDEIVMEDKILGKVIKIDPPIVFFKVIYRGCKIEIGDCELEELYLEKPE